MCLDHNYGWRNFALEYGICFTIIHLMIAGIGVCGVYGKDINSAADFFREHASILKYVYFHDFKQFTSLFIWACQVLIPLYCVREWNKSRR